jgi:hypothetical protein
MTDLWCPGANRHPLGNTGAMSGGPARATWHVTANEHDWTFKNELGWFSGGGAGWRLTFCGTRSPGRSPSSSLPTPESEPRNYGDVRTNRTGKYNIRSRSSSLLADGEREEVCERQDTLARTSHDRCLAPQSWDCGRLALGSHELRSRHCQPRHLAPQRRALRA